MTTQLASAVLRFNAQGLLEARLTDGTYLPQATAEARAEWAKTHPETR